MKGPEKHLPEGRWELTDDDVCQALYSLLYLCSLVDVSWQGNSSAQEVCQDLKSQVCGQSWDQFSGLGKTKQEEVSLEDSRRGLEGGR